MYSPNQHGWITLCLLAKHSIKPLSFTASSYQTWSEAKRQNEGLVKLLLLLAKNQYRKCLYQSWFELQAAKKVLGYFFPPVGKHDIIY